MMVIPLRLRAVIRFGSFSLHRKKYIFDFCFETPNLQYLFNAEFFKNPLITVYSSFILNRNSKTNLWASCEFFKAISKVILHRRASMGVLREQRK